MANYEIWLTQSDNTRIKLLEPTQINYTIVYGDVSLAQIQLAKFNHIEQQRIPNRRINIWRTPLRGTPKKIWTGFVRAWDERTGTNGAQWLTLIALSAEDLLKARIVAGDAETSGTIATSEEADDLMKRLVNEAIVAPSVQGRTLGIITKDPDVTLGTQLNMNFSRKNLLATLKTIQAASKAQGNEVFFAMVPNGDNWVFRTWINQPGNDRTTSGNTPLVFGEAWNNLDNLRKRDDYSKEINFVYAGGQGIEGDRNVQEVSDTARINIADYNRREGYATATQASTDDGVTAVGRDFLERNRPRTAITADILDTFNTPFGGKAGWSVGDRVTLDVYGSRVDAIIRSASVKVLRGKETVKARVEVV